MANMNALVLDDNPAMLSLLKNVLSRRGYTVSAYASATACPHYTAARCPSPEGEPCPDIVLTDLDMPEVNGIDLARALQRKGCGCRHYALISGSWTEEARARATELGMKLISKPFRLSDVYAWLDAIEPDIRSTAPLTASQAGKAAPA